MAFEVPSAPELSPGGEAHVAVRRGKPSRAKVLSIEPKGAGAIVRVKLADPSGTFLLIPPDQFRLVRETAEAAFRVPSTALVENENGVFVITAQQKRASARGVEVLVREADSAVIRAPDSGLRDNDQVVVSRYDEGTVSEIADGASLEVENR